MTWLRSHNSEVTGLDLKLGLLTQTSTTFQQKAFHWFYKQINHEAQPNFLREKCTHISSLGQMKGNLLDSVLFLGRWW